MRVPGVVLRVPNQVVCIPSDIRRVPCLVLNVPNKVVRVPSVVLRVPSTVVCVPSLVFGVPSKVMCVPSVVPRVPSGVLCVPTMVLRDPSVVLCSLNRSGASSSNLGFPNVPPQEARVKQFRTPLPLKDFIQKGKPDGAFCPRRQLGRDGAFGPHSEEAPRALRWHPLC